MTTAAAALRASRGERTGWKLFGTHMKLPAAAALGSLLMNATPAAAQAESAPASSPLPAAVDELWERRAELSPADSEASALVVAAVDMIDSGQARVAQVSAQTGEVEVDERAKRAILLAFRLLPMVQSQVGEFRYHDRVPLTGQLDGVRAVMLARSSGGEPTSHPARSLMPSFVNIGAASDSGTMVDTWATVGSCAQIGKNVHLAGGVGIGGVLEPPNARPVVVEDEAVIFSRCMVVGGSRVRTGAVVGAGTILTESTHVIDVETGEELPRGEVPAWSVCVGGTRTRKFGGGVRPAVRTGAQAAAGGERPRQGSAQRHPARPRRQRLIYRNARRPGQP